MSHSWTKQTSNFGFQGNELSHNTNQNLSTKAYLNPQIVNYEFIKRALSKNSLQGSSKIHVNPNFRGNGINNSSNGNYSHIIDAINSLDMSKPGTSNIPSVSVEKSSINSPSNGNERPLNYTTALPLQSRFKKINAVNTNNNNNINNNNNKNTNKKKKKKSMYSWSKSTDNSSLLSSNSHNTNTPPVNNNNSVLKKSSNFYYNCLANKYASPKKWQVSEETWHSEKNHSIYKSKTKIINKSKTKSTNNFSPKTKLNFKENIHSPAKRQLNLSKFSYNRNKKSSVAKVAKTVKNKYIYLSNLEQFKKSKYKIDKRSRLSETVKKKSNLRRIRDIRKLFPSYIYNKVKLLPCKIYNLDGYKSISKGVHLWRKNQHYGKVTQKMINNEFPNRRVIKIGGILYKSTANKLTLASKKVESSSKRAINNTTKAKKNYIVYVRGEKFILENNGKALRRQSENITSEKTLLLTPQRIDIGGVTYIRKSQNVLIRTNVHQARYLVNKAKNKSIALLTNLHKRSTMPCMIYHRFGRCIRHTKGLCRYKHDPKNIAVCKKFLEGKCSDNNCLLSHQVLQEKMATCHFFLKGLCVRENCPYLHVKLNKNADICENFLQGFCNLGKECSKRHWNQCPKFDKNGSCNLGSKCPYPHKTLKKTRNLCENSGRLKTKSETLQYYVHSDTQRKQKIKKCTSKVKESVSAKAQKKLTKKKSLFLNGADQSSNTIECFPKRIKLDKLPCFIPLNSNS